MCDDGRWNIRGSVFLGVLAMTLLFRAPLLAQTGRLNGSKIKKTIKTLAPIHEKLGDPKPGEWLSAHKEKGQTYAQYVRIRPNVLTRTRNKLYVQPIGEFSDSQKEIIRLSAEFLGIYFNCRVETLEIMDESEFPDSAKRVHPSWGDKQLLTSHILENVLSPRLQL